MVKKTYEFQSEVKQLLHLMIHSLYSNKEVFLRELISNASDAMDKFRFLCLSKPDLYKNNEELCIQISFNKTFGTITVSDNGIGMSQNDVIDNIGTIAKSGTRSFLQSIDSNQKENNQLIGQFGVGFYSVFIVANKVVVLTRSATANIDEGVIWESSGEGNYIIDSCSKEKRGTDVILYLRNEEREFVDEWKIKSIVNRYSNHIPFPIYLKKRLKNNKKPEENSDTLEKINIAQAIWSRKRSEISNEEYIEFYKSVFHDTQDPLVWSHNRVEGKQEYVSLIYIPRKAPWDIWNREYRRGIKLYVQRVFIMDDSEKFVPNYLRFVRGLIDSNSLPLNVSREILQNERIVQNIKSSVIRRILSMLENMMQKDIDKYHIFWKEFGLILKEGIGEDPTNSKEITNLLLFSSTIFDDSEKKTNLQEYVNRMTNKQKKIYYIIADSYSAAKSSPHIEILKKNKVEVLLLFDRIDAWMMSYLVEFNGKYFQSVNKVDHSLNELIINNNKEKEEDKKIFESLINRITKYLGDRVKEVRLTYRLIDAPSVVITESDEMTTQMAKLFSVAGQDTPKIKYIFEINPNHQIIKYIAKIDREDTFMEWIDFLLDQALFVECGTLENPNRFINCINRLLGNKIFTEST